MRSFAMVAALLVVSCKGSNSTPGTAGSAAPPTAPAAATIPGVELADLAGPGTVPYEAGAQLLVVAPGGIRLEGRQVVALQDGVVDPSEKEGGALGLKIPRLTAALATGGGPDGELDIAFDKRLTYGLLIQVLFSAKQKEAGRVRFNIVARAGGKLVAIPIALPSKAPAGISAPNDLKAQLDAVMMEESSLDPDTVLAKIKASYMKGITRCYKDVLKSDPTARGAVKLAFTVNATGRVDGPSADGVDAGLEACVEKAMAGWKFPIPRDHHGDATEASFQVTLRLVPDGEPAPVVEPPPAPPPPPPPDDLSIKPVVSMTATDLILWSFTGLEGTLQAPKLNVARAKTTAVAEVTQALAEIVQRRWGSRARPETTYDIVVMAEHATTVQAVTEIFAAVRATPDGKPLFRDILLSAGFE